MAATVRISERVSLNALAGIRAEDINESEGWINNVAICGPVSENGRDYPTAMMAKCFSKYDGAVVNFDHLDGVGPRKFEDRGGWLSDIRLGDDGRPRARLNLVKSDNRSAKVFELAKRNPKSFGLSHVAHCHTSLKSGREVVEDIASVESVDIVADPATNKGLFEGRRNAVKKTFREVLNGLRSKFDAGKQSRVRKLLLASEDDLGMTPVMDAEVEEPAADADPNEALESGFKAAIDAAWEAYKKDHDIDAFLDAVEKYAGSHFDLIDDGDEYDDDVEDDDEGEDEKKEAVGDGSGAQKAQQRAMHAKDPAEKDKDGDVIGWRRRKNQRKKGKRKEVRDPIREAIAVCGSIGFRPDATDIDVIAATAPGQRVAVAERLKKATESVGGIGQFFSQGRDELATAKKTESKGSGSAKLGEGWIE